MDTRITEEIIKSEKITQYVKCFEVIDGKHKCLVEQCESILSNNSAAIRHLKGKHKNVVKTIDDSKNAQGEADSIDVKFTARTETLWNVILYMIVLSATPFAFLKSKGFQYLIQPFTIAFRLAGIDFTVNRKNTQSKIAERAEQLKQIIRKEVDGNMVCLLLDIASRFNRSIFGINIAYFYNGKVRIRTIGMQTLKITQTGRNLYEIVKEKLSDFGITIQQVFAVTTDNGKNLIKLSQLMKKELMDSNDCPSDDEIDEYDEMSERAFDQSGIDEHYFDTEIFNEEYFDDLLRNVCNEFSCPYDGLFSGISCAAHGLHLVVTEAVKQCRGINALIEKCRTMAKKMRTPNLRAALKESGKKMAILDVKTRWSSTFNMVIQSALK